MSILKLELDLVIDVRPGFRCQTAVRIHDKKSMRLAVMMALSGGFGRYSKTRYRVVCRYINTAAGEVTYTTEVPLLKYVGNNGNAKVTPIRSWVVHHRLESLVADL